MNKNILRVSILISGILVAGTITNSVVAQTDGQAALEISYPVAELGNCADKAACKTYCDEPANIDTCLSFAEKNNLMSKEAKKVKAAITKGIKPPACGGKEACDAYCSSSEHIEECVGFGEAAGIISKEDAERIRKKGDKGTGPNKDNRQGPDGQQGQGGPEGQGGGPGGPGDNGGGGRAGNLFEYAKIY